MEIHVDVYEKSGITVIKPLMKRFDASVASSFKQKLHVLIHQGNRKLLIDLEHVDFMDSSGLGTIISGLSRIGDEGAIKLCCVSEQPRKLLQLTRLDRVLQEFASEETGLNSF